MKQNSKLKFRFFRTKSQEKTGSELSR